MSYEGYEYTLNEIMEEFSEETLEQAIFEILEALMLKRNPDLQKKVHDLIGAIKDRLDRPEYPESTEKIFFPWKASMPGKVTFLKETCPDCGEKLVSLYFKSPAWTWEQLCGRAGFMKICPHCPRQIEFSMTVMNELT